MSLKKNIKKLSDFNTINFLETANRDVTLISILLLSKKFSFFYLHSLIQQKMYLSFVEKNKTKKISSKKEKRQKKMWIYISEEQNYATDIYSKYEKELLEKSKINEDFFVSVGSRAKNFFEEKKIVSISSYPSTETENLAKKIFFIVKNKILKKEVSEVNFFLNSNKIEEKYVTIFPVRKFKMNDRNFDDGKLINVEKFFIYPEIEKFITNNLENYLLNAIETLIIESSFFMAKNKLVKQNKTLKDLEEKIIKIKRNILKIKRDLKTEEIIMISKGKTDF